MSDEKSTKTHIPDPDPFTLWSGVVTIVIVIGIVAYKAFIVS